MSNTSEVIPLPDLTKTTRSQLISLVRSLHAEVVLLNESYNQMSALAEAAIADLNHSEAQKEPN